MNKTHSNFANDFDLQVFRLVSKAEQAQYWSRSDRQKTAEWREIEMKLRHVRSMVRGMMSEADRRSTQ